MKYTDLDSFTRAYIQTALWSSTDDSGDPLDRNYSESNLAPETLERMASDCRKFRETSAWRALLEALENEELGDLESDLSSKGDGAPDSKAGHDFWLTRVGHGAGFWDGDWPEPFAQQLTEASHAFGNVDLYVGDDGLIYAL